MAVKAANLGPDTPIDEFMRVYVCLGVYLAREGGGRLLLCCFDPRVRKIRNEEVAYACHGM